MPYRPTIEETLARYAEAWSTDDPDARWSLVHASVSAEAIYLGPESETPVRGQAALAAFLGLPRDLVRVEIGVPDVHHDRLRAGCRWVMGEGEATGLLVARFDTDHRLVEIVHFDD